MLVSKSISWPKTIQRNNRMLSKASTIWTGRNGEASTRMICTRSLAQRTSATAGISRTTATRRSTNGSTTVRSRPMPKRKAIYNKIQEQVMGDAAYVPLYNVAGLWGFKKAINTECGRCGRFVGVGLRPLAGEVVATRSNPEFPTEAVFCPISSGRTLPPEQPGISRRAEALPNCGGIPAS